MSNHSYYDRDPRPKLSSLPTERFFELHLSDMTRYECDCLKRIKNQWFTSDKQRNKQREELRQKVDKRLYEARLKAWGAKREEERRRREETNRRYQEARKRRAAAAVEKQPCAEEAERRREEDQQRSVQETADDIYSQAYAAAMEYFRSEECQVQQREKQRRLAEEQRRREEEVRRQAEAERRRQLTRLEIRQESSGLGLAAASDKAKQIVSARPELVRRFAHVRWVEIVKHVAVAALQAAARELNGRIEQSLDNSTEWGADSGEPVSGECLGVLVTEVNGVKTQLGIAYNDEELSYFSNVDNFQRAQRAMADWQEVFVKHYRYEAYYAALKIVSGDITRQELPDGNVFMSAKVRE